MNKLIFLLFFLCSYIHINLGIYVCEECKSTRDENGFYYGWENNEECIIDPQRCNTGVYRDGYFNTCKKCQITVFVNHIFYGWENNTECQIDVDYCNRAYGNLSDRRKEEQNCKYCFFSSFDNKSQTYYGFENGQHCYLNMSFCFDTNSVEKKNDKDDNYCKWCEPIDSVEINPNIKLRGRDSDGIDCVIDHKKCGLLNILNYNLTKKVCTYCSVMKKENDEYYSRENNEYCTIDKKQCTEQIKIFDTYEEILNPKNITVQASTALKYFNYNIFISVILLIPLINYMF